MIQNKTNISEKEQNILFLIKSIKDIYLGMRYSLDHLFLRNRRIDLERINQITEEITSYTDCAVDLKPYFHSLYKCMIFFLYAECTSSDRIVLSLVKLGETVYKESDEHIFCKITFGIMIDDAKKNAHHGIEKVAYEHLCNEANILSELHDTAHNLPDVYSVVKKAVENYVDLNGISCLLDDETYQQAVKKDRKSVV